MSTCTPFGISGFHAQDFKYYVKPVGKQAATWEDLPDDIRETYDRLGIPEVEPMLPSTHSIVAPSRT